MTDSIHSLAILIALMLFSVSLAYRMPHPSVWRSAVMPSERIANEAISSTIVAQVCEKSILFMHYNSQETVFHHSFMMVKSCVERSVSFCQ